MFTHNLQYSSFVILSVEKNLKKYRMRSFTLFRMTYTNDPVLLKINMELDKKMKLSPFLTVAKIIRL